MLPANAPEDPAMRLDSMLREFHRMILDTEPQQRTMLRLSLEGPHPRSEDLPLRQGPKGWLDQPTPCHRSRHRCSKQKLQRLVFAIRSATGIEALVWLTDVAVAPKTKRLR